MKIEIKELAKKYEGNQFYTLKDINLSIEDKEFVVLLGPSGSGKTTLLRMISGLNSITSGDLLFGGNRVNELAPKDRDIAMVFQSYALYPHMNVYQNMAFGLKIAKEKKTLIDRRVKDTAEILNISEYLYKKPSDLSGGQRQRVALGRAIVRKPSIFLMDEPLSNLDAKLREKMRSEIVRIHNMLNTTTIYVTHDQLEAMTMATKIVLIDDQRIVQIASPEKLFNKPSSVFAAEFIGSPSMNLIVGTVKNGVFTAKKGSVTAKLSKKHINYLKKFKISEIKLGFRGSDATIQKSAAKDLKMSGEVMVVENLGVESLVTLDYDFKTPVAILTRDKSVKVGNKFSVNVSNKDFHIFDSRTKQRITENFKELEAAWEKHDAFKKQQKQLSANKRRIFSLKRKSK